MALAEQRNPTCAADTSVRVTAAVSRASGALDGAQALCVAADLLVIWMSALAALGLRFTPAFTSRFGLAQLDSGAHLTSHAGFLLLYSVLVVLFCNAQGLHRSQQMVSQTEESWAVGKAVVFATILQAACICFSGLRFVSRFVIGFTMVMSTILLAGWRRLRWLRLEKAYARGWGCRNVLIVGRGPQALALRAHLDCNQHLGYVVCGLVGCGPENGEAQAVDTLGSVTDLQVLARRHFIDEVLVSVADRQVVKQVVREVGATGPDVRVIPDLYDGLGWGAPVEYLGKFPAIALHRQRRPAGLILKRSTDVVVSAAALAVLAPVFLAVAIAVKLNSRGAVLYASERVGRRGRLFRCYKFRTMVTNADALKASLQHLNERDRVLFKITNDPRATRVGRFLRKYSLDELPQLWNVFKGDMSLVGPRPPLASEVKQYELEHLRRLDALPGITGLWQVEARSNPSFDRYVSLDVDYVDHWNPWLDARIMLKTIAVVLSGTGR